MKNEYEVIKRETLYEGVFRLVRVHVRYKKFNGEWSQVFTREIFERPTAAAILPYDPKLDRVILIEQFRPGALKDSTSPWQIEIAAGMLEKDETPLDVAIREAKEETGCDVYDIKLIQEYFVSPGGSNEYIHIYFGLTDASNINGIHGLEEENEDIRVLNLPAEEAFAKVKNFEIKNSPAIISLRWLEANRDKIN